jgi:hypothetical protein
MEYPLGPFPPELLRYISLDPRVFARLSGINRRIATAIEPVIESICNEPITTREFINFYLKSLRRDPSISFDVRLTNLSPLTGRRERFEWVEFEIGYTDDNRFYFYLGIGGEPGSPNPNYVSHTFDDLTINDFGPWMTEYLDRRRFVVDLVNLYYIYKNRRGCVCRNPNYPLERVLKIVKGRFQRLLTLNKNSPSDPAPIRYFTDLISELNDVIIVDKNLEFNREFPVEIGSTEIRTSPSAPPTKFKWTFPTSDEFIEIQFRDFERYLDELGRVERSD